MPLSNFMIIFVCFLAFCFPFIHAQVQSRGQFDSLVRQVYFGKRSEGGVSQKLKFTAPFHDSAALRAMEKPSLSTPPGPIKVAQAIPVSLDSRRDGKWEADEVNGVNTWSIQIESKTALSLALTFRNFSLPPSGELYVMNDDYNYGAYTQANNKPSGDFAIQPIPGESIFLIYVEPMGASPALSSLLISNVVHGYRSTAIIPNRVKDASGPCEVDVKCVNAWVSRGERII